MRVFPWPSRRQRRQAIEGAHSDPWRFPEARREEKALRRAQENPQFALFLTRWGEDVAEMARLLTDAQAVCLSLALRLAEADPEFAVFLAEWWQPAGEMAAFLADAVAAASRRARERAGQAA